MTRRAAAITTWVVAALALAGLGLLEATRPTAAPVAAVDPSTFLDAAAIEAALDYRRPLRVAAVVSVLLRAGTGAAVLVWLRRRADRPAAQDRGGPRGGLLGVGLAGAAVWAAADLVRLPLQIWAWDRSVAAGLSTQDFWAWLGDWLLQAVPYWVGVALAVAGAVWLRRRVGAWWVPLAGVAGGVAGALLIVAGPLVFEPLLFDFTPLAPGDLREDIEALLARSDEPRDTRILVADASRRTTTSNAYVSGLAGTRRIVLYDNLIADAPQREVVAIVAHELAHDQHHDIERAAGALVAVSVLTVLVVDRLVVRRDVPAGSHRIGPRTAARAVAVVLLLAVVFTPVGRWSSRRSEAAADARALELTADPEGYRAMMAGLARRNLSDPYPPRWTVGLFYSHPPIASRIARAAGEG